MTTEANLQIQSNPYQITNSIFTELEWKFSQFVWTHKRLQMAKDNLEKEKEILANSVPWLQTIVLYLFSHYVLSDLFATLWTVASQDPVSTGFPRQEYWSELPFLLHGIFLIQGSNPCLLHWQADSLPLSHLGSPLTEYGGYILLVNNQQHQPKTVCTEISSIAPKLVRLSSSLVSSYNLYRVGQVLIFLSSCRHIILDEWVSVISIILLEMTYWKLNGFSSGWT